MLGLYWDYIGVISGFRVKALRLKGVRFLGNMGGLNSYQYYGSIFLI